MSNVKTIGLWAAIVLTSLVYAAAGIGKLMGVPMLHESFAILGLPGWFGYFIGAAELAGAVGLYWRRTATLAGAGLAIIMMGAIYFHLVYTPISAGIPAIVLLILATTVAWLRRSELIPSARQRQVA